MSAQTLLSGGDKWYSYSGVTFGDLSVPTTIQLVFIPNTGLKDSYIVIEPFYAAPVTRSNAQQLGIEVKLDDVTIYKSQRGGPNDEGRQLSINLFIPRQSKLEIISLNTSGNNAQERGAALIGYYL